MDDADVARIDAAIDALAQELATLRQEVAALRPAAIRPAAHIASPAQAPAQAVITSPVRPAAPPTRDLENTVGQRVLLFIGAFLVLCGVAFFLKIAFDRNWIGPAMRVALGVVAGAALLGGAELRRSKLPPYFADTMVGLGAAIEFLALYSAGMVFGLLPTSVVYLSMSAVTAVVGLIAYVRVRQPLIFVALAGGYITPLFFSSATPNFLALFTYLAILSAFGIAISELRKWEVPPLISLIAVAAYWLAASLDAHRFPPGQALPVAVLLYAIFASTSIVSFVQKRAPSVVRTLVLGGNALLFFAVMTEFGRSARIPLAITLLLIAAAHVVIFGRIKARVQLHLAALALAFAVPPLAFSLSANNDVAFIVMHLGWIALGLGALYAAAGSRDTSLAAISAFLSALTVCGVVWNAMNAPETTHVPLFFNDRFLSLGALAASVLLANRRLRGGAWLSAGWQTTLPILFDLLFLVALSPEAYRLGEKTSESAGQLAISLTWALYGGALVAIGFRTNAADRRWAGLVLLAITVLKVLAADLTGLDIALRVIAALATGIVLIALAFVYQRRASRRSNA